MASGRIVVEEGGEELAFSFEEMVRFNGAHSPGGVAVAYKALERALPLLAPGAVAGRRDLEVRTAFGGPGARDAFELVARAVSDGRYEVDPALARPRLGRARERFVFVLAHRGRTVTLVLRDGFVTEEFVDLARRERRGAAEEARLAALKADLAARVMAAPAPAVFDAETQRNAAPPRR